jgi:FKBP-type peptidyl-prolyl cis-trans isomerase FkpA
MFITTLILFSACKDDEVDQLAVDKAIIQQYIEEHNLVLEQLGTTGIYYKIIKPGYSGSPSYTTSVEVTYKGYLTDGTIFDKTWPGLTKVISLSNAITGWKYAVPILQRGGSGIFIIPSTLGYGSTKIGDVPANSVLIFEINLVDF